jgi:hypothetical protein
VRAIAVFGVIRALFRGTGGNNHDLALECLRHCGSALGGIRGNSVGCGNVSSRSAHPLPMYFMNCSLCGVLDRLALRLASFFASLLMRLFCHRFGCQWGLITFE